jgi:RNA polymerase sigma-70 factor, ECF subfamily
MTCFKFLKQPELRLLSDENLMAQLHTGEHDALAVIVDRYQRLVWSVASRIVRDPGEAEDVVQSVFLELFKKMALFDPNRGTLKTWLLQLAYTRSINRRHLLERRKFYSTVEIDEQRIGFGPGPANPAQQLTPTETAHLIRELLSTLEPGQKVAVELIALEGLTFQELADRTGETVVNAKHHYYRGIIKLRQYLAVSKLKQETTEKKAACEWEVDDVKA